MIYGILFYPYLTILIVILTTIYLGSTMVRGEEIQEYDMGGVKGCEKDGSRGEFINAF